MNALPDDLLAKVLSFMPPNAFLPTAHVSKRFRKSWLQRTAGEKIPPQTKSSRNATNPLQVGNLFQTHWNKSSVLSTALLEYYVSCGWDDPLFMHRVLREAAARGDIPGMAFLLDRNLCRLDDADICTVAGAAGHLAALRWLREERDCPWDPSEVLREASENLHVTVMTYVELNSAGYEIVQSCYGDGLPW